ncbi:hypothetical protein [Kingella denitrificans]|uniref:hypothetical protein n=1 Tax=Kingella denitrificans TaxID=502 RepID=UPI000B986B7F|nr:hypothetical protein [Kingella denitrificans]
MKSSVRIPKIFVNAEFQRLLWLNLNWGLVASVILVFGLFIAMRTDSVRLVDYLVGLSGFGLSFAALACLILISRSLKRDISSNMFDQLRMSSLSPWQMAYSRLIATPVLGWVVFACSWLCLIAAYMIGAPKNDLTMMMLAMLPLSVWTLLCLFLTNSLQFKRGLQQWSGNGTQIVLLIINAAIMQPHLLGALSDIREKFDSADFTNSFVNFMMTPSSVVEAAFSSIWPAILMSIAVNAAMAQRLHLRPSKHIFLLCSLLLPFTYASQMLTMPWPLTCLQLAFSYASTAALSILCQDNRPSTFQTGLQALSQGDFRRAFNHLPSWIFLLPLALVFSSLISTILAITLLVNLLVLWCVVTVCCSKQLRFNSITIALCANALLHILYYIAFFMR